MPRSLHLADLISIISNKRTEVVRGQPHFLAKIVIGLTERYINCCGRMLLFGSQTMNVSKGSIPSFFNHSYLF